MYIQYQPFVSDKNKQAFTGYSIGPFKVSSYDGLNENDDDNVVDKKMAEALRHRFEAAEKLYLEFEKENEMIFRENIRPDCIESAGEIINLPSYNTELLPFLTNKKKSDIEYLHKLAAMKDISGEIRIPGCTFPFFSEIEPERLRMLEPIITSKNDMGLWNYGPSFILDLNENYSDKEIYIMSKLADCKVNGKNLIGIATHHHINHNKTIEKAKELNQLFGKDLREIEFFSNRNGENWLSADIQLPHREDKSDWMNFRRVFSKLDDDVNPFLSCGVADDVDKYVDDIYSRLEDKMCIYKEKDLDNAIYKVKLDNPDAKDDEILRTMQKLTQFANYSSLSNVESTLQKDNVGGIMSNLGVNTCFDYLANKHIIKLDKDKNQMKVFFITKQSLNDKNFKMLLKHSKEVSDKIEFVNLEGWSDGINFLRDNGKLAEYTSNVYRKAKKIEAKNEKYNFKDALEHVLNKEIENKISGVGLNIRTIRNEAPATKEVILEQMNPSMPSKSMLKSTIASIAQFYTKDNKKEFSQSCKNIAQYFDENINVYSKQGMIEDMKYLHNKIENFLKQNDLQSENLYYISPKMEEAKSFDIVAKMYAELYNIPQEKFIKVDGIGELQVFPQNSTFVVLDDVMGSGSSMAGVGEYDFYGKVLGKDKHILFCPITTNTDGLEYVNSCIEENNRKGIDKVLYIQKNTKDYSTVKRDFIENGNEILNETIFGYSGHGQYGMCTVFPYMAPDNNSDLSSHMIKFFVPNHDCIKSKDLNLSKIEENTLYFDIFGTDKEHIETDAHKVYNPKQKSKISSFFSMF